ncbi:SRPBCC family protein [Lysobacter enzymogenes]|uniref:SRPBCC family protein n=1 Tax=Lysobacter enzymogenes TaxID=69 RepID=UPI0019CFBF69|nr:SRPBCC family protein [Lysobacter enzymogenes]
MNEHDPQPPASNNDASGDPRRGPQPPAVAPEPPPLPPDTAHDAAAAPARRWFDGPLGKAMPFLGGALIGLLLRLVFNGDPGSAWAPMLTVFILLAPIAIGAITVYLAERQQARRLRYHFFAPWLSVTLCMAGTMLFVLEGAICVVLIWPLFAVLGSIGGMLMGALCRWAGWSKTPTVYSLAILPLLLTSLGIGHDEPRRLERTERSVLIHAAPDAVWRQLLNADHIRAEEVDRAWMYRIGVPTPLAGLTHEDAAGLTREVRMGKGIHFRQRSADWQPGRYVQWQYQFAPDSVPPGALDDHVDIGGRYFDLTGTRYTLTPRGADTELSIRMDYRVSTGFNWYAAPLARWLIGDFSDTILQFYRHRAEAAAG